MKTLFFVWFVFASVNIGYVAYQKTGNGAFGFQVAATWTVVLPAMIMDIWNNQYE